MTMNPREFQHQLEQLSTDLSHLKALYEQYIQGYERVEPKKQKELFEKKLRRLVSDCPTNTASKFKLNTLKQRFVTLQNHWRRVCRQIEEGTFKRDLAKARRRRANSQFRSELPRPSVIPNGPKSAGEKGIDDRRMREIYDEYARARSAAGQSSAVGYEQLSKKLNGMVPKLQQKHKGKKIDFKVVVRGGKIGLKPIVDE